jgi:hypothetical protein
MTQAFDFFKKKHPTIKVGRIKIRELTLEMLQYKEILLKMSLRVKCISTCQGT